MAVKVTFKDTGLSKLRETLKRLGKLNLTIGFQGPGGRLRYESGVNVATVALMNEFGTEDAPQRSFLRSTFFEFRARIQQILGTEIGKAIVGTIGPVESLANAGRQIVALVERKIDASKGWAKPNAPSTIAQKGFDYPLHDTELMRDNVTWAVRQGRSIIAIGGSS